MTFWLPFITGFLLEMSLVSTLRKRNTLVLQQGLLRQYVLPTVLIGAFSDTVLICAGILGLGRFIYGAYHLDKIIMALGAVFLFAYGLMAAKRSIKPDVLVVAADGSSARDWKETLALLLSLTWLNATIYLDTAILLGNVSSIYSMPMYRYFGLGAVAASFLWFLALGYGARLLAPVFARPWVWRVLDGLMALIMFMVALALLVHMLDLRSWDDTPRIDAFLTPDQLK